MGATQQQIERKERHLENLYAELADLKNELKTPQARLMRSMVRKDIQWCENAIKVCKLKIGKMKKSLAQ